MYMHVYIQHVHVPADDGQQARNSCTGLRIFLSLESHTVFVHAYVYYACIFSGGSRGGGGFRGLQPPQKVSSPSFVEPR